MQDAVAYVLIVAMIILPSWFLIDKFRTVLQIVYANQSLIMSVALP
ncbi:MAG: hypothetical protein ACJASY_002487 [Halioglobus sp.]|jgi:hypothetical protein